MEVERLRDFGILIIFLSMFFTINTVYAGLYYTGDISLENENVLIKVEYGDNDAILIANSSYTLKNNGEDQEIEYGYYVFGQFINGGILTLSAGEEKIIFFNTSKVLQDSYTINMDFNLMLSGKYIGTKTQEGEFIIKYPSKPTIISMNPQPTHSTDLELIWSKTDYIPVFNILVSWVKEEINVDLKKEIIPSTLLKNDVFTVKSIIKNNDNVGYKYIITDIYSTDFYEPVDKTYFEELIPESPMEPSYWKFERELEIGSNEEKVFEYQLEFLGAKGISEMEIPPFNFFISDKNFYKYSNKVGVLVNVCNFNNICEIELDEYYLNCPQDCVSGSVDGYCDGIADGICDEDCLAQSIPELDSDCSSCGDGKCDLGETRENCCVDCGCIGGMKCQDNKCVKTEICGDGTCSIHETYEKCKEDCPSGSKDNYCDKVEDNICDPDCARTRDVDCLCNKDGICESNFETNSNCPEDCESDNTIIYLILGSIALISIIIYLRNRSKKTKWKEIYEETSN
ncbi:MAG: hypothetical protein KAT28_01395 [Candidatus Aenigmarchaeota archaeon]|nr:hypothetical protein [Candidatus Aenigmarchaeota archaeon]